jgi:NADH-quinone oxidoreductase subunit A
MNAAPLNSYIPVILMMVFPALMVGVALFASRLVSNQRPNKLKQQAYECGEDPQGSPWSQFNMRFYVVGLIFIIFDVESVLMFPVVSIFRSMVYKGMGGIVLVEILILIFILLGGISYFWKKGDLDWVKTFQERK